MAQTEKHFDFNFYNSKESKKSLKNILTPWICMFTVICTIYGLEVRLHNVSEKSQELIINEQANATRQHLYEILNDHGQYLGKKVNIDDINVKIDTNSNGFTSCEIKAAGLNAKVWSGNMKQACRDSIYYTNALIFQKEQEYIKIQKENQQLKFAKETIAKQE